MFSPVVLNEPKWRECVGISDSFTVEMQKIGFVLLVVAASLFECTDAHGFHHPISNEQDFSFENIVEQKYPTLPTKFISKHRRQLAKDFTHESGSETVPICDPKCYQNPENGNWLSCDDLVRII